ncbi:MAG: spore coat protein CotJB [Acutalibacteraceae bacterium]|nr:spore coat protein CotJB [Acutalibacteraceae bacterium]
MMMTKQQMKNQISQYDFTIKEIELFLDTHPNCQRALHALNEYRKRRAVRVSQYERQFGRYIVTTNDVPCETNWQWLDSPWPWEREVDF